MRSPGGIGRALIFATDGSAVTAQMGMTPDARYLYDGKRLQVTETDGATSGEELTVSGDTLFWGPPGRTSIFIRDLDGTAGRGIAGRWATAGGGGPPGYLVFTADRVMQARVILEAVPGAYAASGDRLTLTFAGRAVRFRYEIVADTLVLTPPSGSRERYLRGR